MIRDIDISLMIPCGAASATTVSDALGVQPSRVQELPMQVLREDGGWHEKMLYVWVLDSPKKTDAGGDPIARLNALADLIEAFGSRLPSIRSPLKPLIMILYHITPGDKFGQLRVPAELMRRYSSWNLDVVVRLAAVA